MTVHQYLIKIFINTSSLHAAVNIFLQCASAKIGTKKILLERFQYSFDNGIVKNLRKSTNEIADMKLHDELPKF